jgi:hypothetical protein
MAGDLISPNVLYAICAFGMDFPDCSSQSPRANVFTPAVFRSSERLKLSRAAAMSTDLRMFKANSVLLNDTCFRFPSTKSESYPAHLRPSPPFYTRVMSSRIAAALSIDNDKNAGNVLTHNRHRSALNVPQMRK